MVPRAIVSTKVPLTKYLNMDLRVFFSKFYLIFVLKYNELSNEETKINSTSKHNNKSVSDQKARLK